MTLFIGLGLPIKTVKSYGFYNTEPRYSLDFVLGEYKKDGLDTSLSSLNIFKRNSKAYLLKESGLNEYVIDVPRFKEGLLIEEKSTNLLNESRPTANWINTYTPELGTVIDPLGGANLNWFKKIGTSFQTLRLPSIFYDNTTTMSLTLIIKADIDILITSTTGVSLLPSTIDFTSGKIVTPPEAIDSSFTSLGNGWAKITITFKPLTSETSYGFQIINKTENAGFALAHAQVEIGKPSSIIPTSTSPVTRQSDLLTLLGTYKKVKGDWDSTVNLEIVKGNLVHSGSGFIRNLIIY